MIRWASVGWIAVFASVASAQTADAIKEAEELLARPPRLGPRAGPFGGPRVAVNAQPVPVPPRVPPAPGADRPFIPDDPGLPRPIRPAAPSPSGPAKLDRHGDPMPPGAIARFGTIRLRHGVEPTALGFTPDGKHLVSIAANDEGMRLWDPITGKEVARLDTRITFAALARDGQVLIADGDRCKVWAPPLKVVRDLPEGTLPEGTNCLAVAPDCRTFAVGCPGKIVLRDIQTGKPRGELKTPIDQPPHRLIYSPDGRWLAAAGPNKIGVWLWDLKTNRRIRTYPITAEFSDFAFSPDGSRLVIAGEQLRIFTTDSEEPLEGFSSPDGQFFAVRFAANGKEIFAAQPDGTVVQVNAETGELKDSWAPPDLMLRTPLTLAPGAERVAAIEQTGGIRVWEPRTGKGPEAERLPALLDPGFSADGKTAAVIDLQGRVYSFDLKTGQPGEVIELPVEDFFPGTFDIRTGRVAMPVGSEAFEVHIIEVKTRKVLAKIPANSPGLPTTAFCPSDRDKLAVFVPGMATIHSISTGRTLRTIELSPPETDTRGCFSPDGRLLAATSRPLTVWEVGTGKKRFVVEAMEDPRGVTFSPDGRRLATWDGVDMVIVFDIRTGTTLRRFQLPSAEGTVNIAAFTPDGKRLATGGDDGLVTIWDVASGEPLLNLDRHDGMVTGLAFSADGSRLISTASDGTALVWDLTAKVEPRATAVVAGADEAFRLLGSSDAGEAQRGMEYLYRNPADAVTMLGKKIPTPTATPADRIARLVADLGNDDFQTRRAAVAGLVAIGGEAAPAVRQAAMQSPNSEVRKLAEEVLARLDGPASKPDDLRLLRAVEVVEGIGTPEARELIRKWAAGPPGHRLTVEATAALSRIEPKKKQ